MGTLLLAVGLGSRRAGRGSNIRSFAFVAVSNARKHPPTGAELAKKRETPIVSGPFEEIEKASKYRLVGLKLPRTCGRFFMAMVQGKECGGQISENADASRAKEVKPVAPEKLGIRFGKGANDATFRTRLAETVAKSTGHAWSKRQLPMALTPGTYEIWLPAIDGARHGRQ